MRNVYSVSQINSYIKNMFTQDYMLRSVYVKGEVSNVRYHSSGHIYFTLKDQNGTLNCIMFASNARQLRFRMSDGQQVVAMGSIEVYERDGKYQLYAKDIVPDGAGVLHERFEQLKRELSEMGMFAPEYKKPIPKYARRVGVVTAKGGAAVRDIINIATRRNPYVQLILYPAIVQGDDAAISIVNGIRALDAMNLDVIIVGRGGGSIEDLWAFNEEIVARAIFDCITPVVSAVGHETDTTIADYVADLRAPTPSAAAELTVFSYDDYLQACVDRANLLDNAMRRVIRDNRTHFDSLKARILALGPEARLRENRQNYINLEDKLNSAMDSVIIRNRHRLSLNVEKMKALSPLSRLGGGYAYVATNSGRAVKSVKEVKKADLLELTVSDGKIKAVVEDIINSDLED